MNLKIIKNAEDHAEALKRLDELFDLDPIDGSKENDELDVLALLIEQYEMEKFPIDKPTPIEAIKFRMDQQNLKSKDLIPYIGSAPKVSEILNNKRSLSLSMIRKLSESLDIPVDILIQDSEKLENYYDSLDYKQFPLAEIFKRGYLTNFSGNLNDLKEYASEYIGDFLRKAGFNSDFQPMLARSSANLSENSKECDAYARLIWQAQIIHKAKYLNVTEEYKVGTVTKQWMQDVAKLSWYESGPQLAIEHLKKFGITVILEKHLPKTYLDGAVCFYNGKPIIALTLRHDSIDNFWFTLMHELAHISLHFDKNEEWFLDNLDQKCDDPREDEANALAREVLIPDNIFYQYPHTDKGISEMASDLKISPCIIAGRIKFEKKDFQLFGKKFRDKTSKILKI